MADRIKPLTPRLTPRRRIVEEVSAERWPKVGADVIAKFKRPWECQLHLLPFLAFEESVDIWNENWPEWKKRSVIASAPADHAIKTTEAGIRRYVDIADGEVRQVVAPPEGFFAASDLSKAEMDAHIAKHPKVRITLARGTSSALVMDGSYCGDGFVDEASTGIDDGPSLWGRRAYLVQDGVQTLLQLTRIRTDSEERAGVVTERIVTPGRATAESFADEIGADVGFADGWDAPPRFYTVSLDQAYSHVESRLELSMVEVGFMPRDTRYIRESLVGDGSAHAFAGGFSDCGFAGRNDGGELLADVLRLYDPAIPSPVLAGGGFADVNRVGMAHHTAEILIDWRMAHVPHSAIVADLSFAGEDPAAPEEATRRSFLLDAVASSKRLSDRIGVTFQTRRPRTLGDGIPLDGSFRLGDTIDNVL